MYTATISAKGQITIPARVRKQLGIKPNDKVILIFRGDEVVLKPLKGNIKSLRGIIPARQKPENFEEVRKNVKQKIVRKRQEQKI